LSNRQHTHPRFSARNPVKSVQRQVDIRPERQRFLIVCEGEKTEPQYFRGFHLPGLVEVEAIGTGRNTQSLVEEALRIRTVKMKEAEQAGSEYTYDQYWCVFDRDSFPADAFNNAIIQAEAAGFQVAYSNEAFELWYLLHFNYLDVALARQGYKQPLTQWLGRPYVKNDPAIHSLLESKQNIAIRNAKRLLANYDPHNPQQDNPCTTVHKLVMALCENSV
jgi:hypothetical protein